MADRILGGPRGGSPEIARGSTRTRLGGCEARAERIGGGARKNPRTPPGVRRKIRAPPPAYNGKKLYNGRRSGIQWQGEPVYNGEENRYTMRRAEKIGIQWPGNRYTMAGEIAVQCQNGIQWPGNRYTMEMLYNGRRENRHTMANAISQPLYNGRGIVIQWRGRGGKSAYNGRPNLLYNGRPNRCTMPRRRHHTLDSPTAPPLPPLAEVLQSPTPPPLLRNIAKPPPLRPPPKSHQPFRASVV